MPVCDALSFQRPAQRGSIKTLLLAPGGPPRIQEDLDPLRAEGAQQVLQPCTTIAHGIESELGGLGANHRQRSSCRAQRLLPLLCAAKAADQNRRDQGAWPKSSRHPRTAPDTTR